MKKLAFLSLLMLVMLFTLVPARADGTPASVVYYVYLPSCEDCARVADVINSIPETVLTPAGESLVELIKLDMTAEAERVFALFDVFSVPADDRLAPIIMAGDKYYRGVDEITEFVKSGLSEGLALGTLAESGEAVEMPALKFASVALAGLVGGLNPCALSMLLLFLSMILNLRGGVKGPAAAFLAAKFLTYILIGTVFLNVFQMWNPTWLPTAAKLILSLVSVVFVTLNLRDAWMARREKYGEIKNQLPSSVRRGLQYRIKAMLENPGKKLTLIAATLGVIVAAGEFLCSGQVYLATLLTSIQRGEAYASMFIMLVVYCLCFLLPSIVLTVIVDRGRAAFGVSEALRKNMPFIKIATALFFIAVLIVVWIL